MRLDELSLVVRNSSRISKDSLSCARLSTKDAQPDELQIIAQVRADG